MQLSHYCVGVVAVLLCTTSALQSDYDYYPTQYYYDNNDDDHDISHTKHDYYTQKDPCPTYGLTVDTADECERAAVLLKLKKADEVEAFRGHAYGCYWENNAGTLYFLDPSMMSSDSDKRDSKGVAICRDNGAACRDLDHGATNSHGGTCPAYEKARARCSLFDTATFVAKTMCCACGGGRKVAVHNNTCIYRNNEMCDDGHECPRGTDCEDCDTCPELPTTSRRPAARSTTTATTVTTTTTTIAALPDSKYRTWRGPLTCESIGLQPIYEYDECTTAARALGHTILGGILRAPGDLVDGCSVLNGKNLYLKRNGRCQPSDLRNCDCSDLNPCLCKVPEPDRCYDCATLSSVDSDICTGARVPCSKASACASTTRCNTPHRSQVVPVDARASSYAAQGHVRGSSPNGPLNLIIPCTRRRCNTQWGCGVDSGCPNQFTEGRMEQGIWAAFAASRQEWIDFDLGPNAAPVSVVRLYGSHKSTRRFPIGAQVFNTTSFSAFGCTTATGEGPQAKLCRDRDPQCFSCKGLWRPHGPMARFRNPPRYRKFVSISLSRPFTGRYLRLVLKGAGREKMNLLAVTFFTSTPKQPIVSTDTVTTTTTLPSNIRWKLVNTKALCFAQTIRLVGSRSVAACAAAAHAQSCAHFMFRPQAGPQDGGANCRCCSKLDPRIPHNSWSTYDLVVATTTTTTTTPRIWDKSRRCNADANRGKRLLIKRDLSRNSYPSPARAAACLTACHAEGPGCCQIDYAWSEARCSFFADVSSVRGNRNPNQWIIEVSANTTARPCADVQLTTILNKRGGQRLPCSQLGHLCHDMRLGLDVRVQCRKTCKQCDSPCVDSIPSWVQQSIFVQRRCPEFRSQCNHRTYGEIIKAECPKTCGMCRDPPSPCSHSDLAAYSRCSYSRSCTASDAALLSKGCRECWSEAKNGQVDMHTCYPPGVTTGHCSILDLPKIMSGMSRILQSIPELCMSCLTRSGQDDGHEFDSCFGKSDCRRHSECSDGFYCAHGAAGGSTYQLCEPITRCREAKDAVDKVCPGMCSHQDLASLSKCIYSDSCDVNKFAVNGLDAECYGCVYTNDRSHCFPDYYTTTGHCSFKSMELILTNQPEGVDDLCLSCVLRVSLAKKSERRSIHDCLSPTDGCTSHSDCPDHSYCASGTSSSLGRYQHCDLLTLCSRFGDSIDGICPEVEGPPSACNEAFDLSAIQSPHRGHTSAFNTINATCAGDGVGGNEQLFISHLPPGHTIKIGLTDTDFDSVHELRVGDTCPGNVSVGCIDDPDGHTIIYHNDGNQEQVVTFLVEFYDQNYSEVDAGHFTLNWQITDSSPASTCDMMLDLADLTSPYNGTTINAYDQVGTSCGAQSEAGNERIFKYLLPAGHGITIGQTDNNFDSVHELLVGTSCPGDRAVECKDDPDVDPLYYYNDGQAPQQIFFVVDTYGRDPGEDGPDVGHFTIEWSVVPGMCAGAVDLNSQKSPLTTKLLEGRDSHVISCSAQMDMYAMDELAVSAIDKAFKYTLQPGMSISLRVSEHYSHFVSELRVGGSCPGDTLVDCSAELTSMPISYHNKGSEAVTVYYHVEQVPEMPEETLTITWETFKGAPPSMCGSAKDLATLKSPLRSTIVNTRNLHSLSCGSEGNEQAFIYKLPPGYTIAIAQTDNTFDSKHELRTGDTCPGKKSLACVDDPDYSKLTYSNDGKKPVMVTFIVDSYNQESGQFTLWWNITNKGSMHTLCEEGQDLALLKSPYTSTASTMYHNTKLSCGDHGSAQLFHYQLPPGRGLAIGQTLDTFESFRELRVGTGCPGKSVTCREGAATGYMSYYNSGKRPLTVSFLINSISTSAAQPYSLSWRVERLWSPSGARGFTCMGSTGSRVPNQFACQVAATEAGASWYSYKAKKDKSKPGLCLVSKECSSLRGRVDKTWQTYTSVPQYRKTTHSWHASWGTHPGVDTGGICTSAIASAYVQCCSGPAGRRRGMRRDCSLGMVQYATAMATCSKKGGEICSMSDIHEGLQGSLGCGFDASTIVWTSDTCREPALGLVNGGFEKYSTQCGQDSANAYCSVTPRAMPGWLVRGMVLRISSQARAWQSVKVLEGKWFVALHGTRGGSLSTATKNLKQGQNYRLSWYERTRPGFPGMTLQVSVQDRVVMEHPVPLEWTPFQVEFTARNTNLIKFEDEGGSSGSILLDDVRVTAAPKTNFFWTVDNTEGGRSCDLVCAGLGSNCVSQAITSLHLQGKDAIAKAFAKAMGWTCQTYREGCAQTGSCITWGSPFLKGNTIGDRTCYGGSSPGLATCGQRPSREHRRLCPCEGQAKCDVSRTCNRECSKLLPTIGAQNVVKACSGCSSSNQQAKCFPGATGWPLLQKGQSGEKPNQFPPKNHYCPDCKPCKCEGAGYGFESCGDLCCAQSPWHPTSSQQCWKKCPAGLVSAGGSKNWASCGNVCANMKCGSHSFPCSKGKCKCKDLYQGLYCDLAPGTPFAIKIGGSAFTRKSYHVNDFVGITCDSVVSAQNWLNNGTSSHVFKVSVWGQGVTVVRTDAPSGWDLDLQFRCTGKRATTSTSTPWHEGMCDPNRQQCRLNFLGGVDTRKGTNFDLCCGHPGQHLCPGDKCCMGGNCASGVCKSVVTGAELGSGNPGNGVCQPGKAAVKWLKGAGSCTDVCAENKMACSEYALSTLTTKRVASTAAKAAGLICTAWNNLNYGMGFSHCKGETCCQGMCDGACFLSRPQRCDAPGSQFGHERICPCQDLRVTDGWLLVLSSNLGSGGGDFAKPGYGYPSSNFKTHLSGKQLHSAGFDMVQIVLQSSPRQSRIFPGQYDLRKLDNTCTRCNCPGNHLGGGLYWHGGGGKCYRGAHFGLASTAEVHVECSGSQHSWWGHFHRNGVNTGVYAYGKNNCVSEKEWDQTYQLFVKKSSRCTDMANWRDNSGNKWRCAQYKSQGICADGRAVGVDCTGFSSCSPERPCLSAPRAGRGGQCALSTNGQCPRGSKQCTKFKSGVKPIPWVTGTLGLSAKQACCACGGGAVDACSLALNLDKLSSPYTTAIPETIRPRTLACGDGTRVKVFKHVLAAGSTITIGPVSRTRMAHALYMGGACPGLEALHCSTEQAAPMTYYNDGSSPVTLYYHVIDQHAWISQTITIKWKVQEGAPAPICDQGIDLKKLKSPYRGDTSTSDLADIHTLSCPGGGTGNEQLHYYSVPPKSWISISAVGGMFDFSHELRAGGSCPGTKSIACSNRPSTKAVQYHNTGTSPVTVYYIIDSFSVSEGAYMIQWQVGGKDPPNICSTSIDLTSRRSPYSGHMFDLPNYHVLSCGGGGSEQAFTYTLPAGHSLSIGQTSNNFDSVQELLVGAACPGRRSVACVDDPDNSTFYYLNDAQKDVTVTFIIDSFETRNSRGDYTLAWNAVNRDLVCTTAISLNDFHSPYYGTTVGKFNTQTPSCGGGGNDQIFRYSLPAGFTLYIGQTNAEFGGIAELTVGGNCPGTTSIRCEGGSDSSGRLMSYHNTGMYAVDVYFMVDAGSAYDMDFTIEWSASDTTTSSSTTSTATINPCVSDPGLCLLFVNDGFSNLKCKRILSRPERRAGVLRQAKQELRKAYAQAVDRTLGEGEQLSDSFVRCGSVWLDMPVQVRDQPALRSYFRRQPLWLFVGTQRVMFRLVGDSVSSTSTSTTSTITDIITMVTTTIADTASPTLVLTKSSTAAPPPDVEPRVEQYGAQASTADTGDGGASAVAAVIVVLLLLLGGAAVVIVYLLFVRKKRDERDAAGPGNSHVYTVEPEAVTVPSAVPVATEFKEEEFDKAEMHDEFDKASLQFAAPAASSSSGGKVARALSTEEAAAWEHASAVMNPMHNAYASSSGGGSAYASSAGGGNNPSPEAMTGEISDDEFDNIRAF